MSQRIEYRELQIKIGDGVTLTVGVTTKADIKEVLADLAEFEVGLPIKLHDKARALDDSPRDAPRDDSPEKRLEMRAGLDEGSLRTKNVLAYKDGVPQLLRPASFASVSDAALILIFSVEAGLKKSSISIDEFKTLYDEQNIKSGSQLSMMLNNLKNSGYIDKAQYSQHRSIRLTAKGEKKATEVLRGISP